MDRAAHATRDPMAHSSRKPLIEVLDFVPSEHEEQARLFEWAATYSDRYPELRELFAVPNFAGHFGRFASRQRAGKRLKAEGRKAGVEDIILLVPGLGAHGLLIELKRINAVPSDVKAGQRWWHERHRERGFHVAICRGWEAAATVIAVHLGIPRIVPEMTRQRTESRWEGWSGESSRSSVLRDPGAKEP